MTLSHIDEQFFNHIIQFNDWQEFVDLGITKDYFDTDEYKTMYSFCETFQNNYGRQPSMITFLSEFDANNFLAIDNPEPSVESLVDCLKDRALWNSCCALNKKINDVLADGNVTTTEKIVTMRDWFDAQQKIMDSNAKMTYQTGESLTQQSIDSFNRPLEIDVYSTGMECLNDIIYGFNKTTDYVVVAGRPGHGKSMLLCKFAGECLKQGLKVGYYSGEMPSKVVVERLLSILYHISSAAIFNRDKTISEEYKKDTEAFNRQVANNLFVVEPKDFGNQYPTASQLGAFCKRCNIDILFIDQHSLMTDQEHAKVLFERAGNISRQIKAMRDKLGIPVVVAVQRNRTVSENGNANTTQLAGSDMIGQDAHKVLIIEKQYTDTVVTHTVTVAKNRDGKQGEMIEFANDFDKGIWSKVALVPQKNTFGQELKDDKGNPILIPDFVTQEIEWNTDSEVYRQFF